MTPVVYIYGVFAVGALLVYALVYYSRKQHQNKDKK